jgi:hypothetical protein
MYQQTLGRFLSRDPLSDNGFDVMTDTGFYSDRLAAMRSDPWYYGGNGENLYVYVSNNPVNLTDPSGLSPALPSRSIVQCGCTASLHRHLEAGTVEFIFAQNIHTVALQSMVEASLRP